MFKYLRLFLKFISKMEHIIIVRGKKFIVDLDKKVMKSVESPRKIRKLDEFAIEYYREMFKTIKR